MKKVTVRNPVYWLGKENVGKCPFKKHERQASSSVPYKELQLGSISNDKCTRIVQIFFIFLDTFKYESTMSNLH